MKSFSADRVLEAHQRRSERRFADIGLRILALFEIIAVTIICGIIMQFTFLIGLVLLLGLLTIIFVTAKILLDDVQILYEKQMEELYGNDFSANGIE